MLCSFLKASSSDGGYADGTLPSGSVFNVGGPHAMRVVKRSLVDRGGLYALSRGCRGSGTLNITTLEHGPGQR